MKNDDQKDDPIGSTRKIHRTLAYWAIVVLRGLSLFVAVASGILVLAYIAAGDVEFWPLLLFLISICLLCFWFGFRGHIARERLLILFGAASGIALGFFAFIGGILWAANQHPESNIAPVMAILFAGPLGFSVGVVLGIPLGVLFQHRKDRQPPNQPAEATQPRSEVENDH